MWSVLLSCGLCGCSSRFCMQLLLLLLLSLLRPLPLLLLPPTILSAP